MGPPEVSMNIVTKTGTIQASAVAFDKDGTLIGNLQTWQYIFKQYVQTARSMGYDIQNEADRLFGVSTQRMDAPLVTYYAKEAMILFASAIWLSYGLSWPQCRKIASSVVENTNRQFDPAILYQPNPGAVELVHFFSQQLPVCIATSDDRPATERMMRYLDIESKISCIITSDEVPAGKPAPDVLLKLCEGLGIEPNQMVYIGDNEVDVQTALNAGSKSISLGAFIPGATSWTETLQDLLKLNQSLP